MSKITNALPAPKRCDSCGSANIERTTNDVIYGQAYGKWPHIYFCNECRAAVGCHVGTFIPLGKMADRQTRYLRKKAHCEFDRIWQDGLMSREDAYNWLAEQLQIEQNECHLSWISKDQLKKTIEVSTSFLTNSYKFLLRRKVKNDTKEIRRNERSFNKENRNAEEARRYKTKRRVKRARGGPKIIETNS